VRYGVVHIRGYVRSPGDQRIDVAATIASVVVDAGGFDAFACRSRFVVLRGACSFRRAALDDVVYPGDAIQVIHCGLD